MKADVTPASQNYQSTEPNHQPRQCAVSTPPKMTRTGRTIRKPQYRDAVDGSDYDQMIGLSSDGVKDDNSKFQQYMPSDPRTYNSSFKSEDVKLLTSHSAFISKNAQEYSEAVPLESDKQQQSPSVSRPHGNLPSSVSRLDAVSAENEGLPSPAKHAPQYSSASHTSFKPSQDVYDIIHNLQQTTKVQLDLPSLSNVSDPDRTQPYSAELLTHLYIACYQQKLWNLCDMIADTWIRAFHTRRKKSQVTPGQALWRPNKALEERKRTAYKAWRNGNYVSSEFDPEQPKWLGLDEATDPDLEPDVTNMHIHLLTTLYQHTAADCGARVLWADALALAGDQTERGFEVAHRRGIGLHHELVFNVMQTSLRLVRRKLTLKIEESLEGAWCKRYHEHARHGQRCYREIAASQREKEGKREYHQFLGAEEEEDGKAMGRPRKKRKKETREVRTKRVSFGYYDSGVDAEKESC
jgi:hypothetical protein